MNNNTNCTLDIPEKVLALIPWFAIGELSANEQKFFDKALLIYPSMQRQLKLEKMMIKFVSYSIALQKQNEITSPEERLKSVFNVIDNLEQDTKATSYRESSSVLDRLKNAFDSLKTSLALRPQYARFASVSVLALSIAGLASLVAPKQKETSNFVLASAVVQPTDNQTTSVAKDTNTTLLFVGFNGTAEELRNNPALKGMQLKIKDRVNIEDFFQISIEDSINADEIKQMIDALLEQKETVWFAGEGF